MTELYPVTEIVRLKQIVCESELPIKKIVSSFEVAEWLQEEIGNESQEVMTVICLNTKNELNSFSIVHRGTINQSIAHPRDIFQRALLNNASRIIISHNHPSNNTTPSQQDCDFTERMVKAGEILGIELLDHIIVGTDNYFSFRENNKM